MGEAVYTVSVEELLPTIKHIIHIATPNAIHEAVRALAYRAVEVMMEESPSSLKSGRGYRGPPFRLSVKAVNHSTPNEAIYTITPTKTVTSSTGAKHELWKILHYGSENPVIIKPVNRKMLKFVGADGKIKFKHAVRRGPIPPHPFVTRTRDRIVLEATGILEETITQEYVKDSAGVSG